MHKSIPQCLSKLRILYNPKNGGRNSRSYQYRTSLLDFGQDLKATTQIVNSDSSHCHMLKATFRKTIRHTEAGRAASHQATGLFLVLNGTLDKLTYQQLRWFCQQTTLDKNINTATKTKTYKDK